MVLTHFLKSKYQVSLLIGNLTWWTSDYELEKFIRKCGVNDLYEVNKMIFRIAFLGTRQRVFQVIEKNFLERA